MKFEGQNSPPGKFASKALFKTANGWELSDNYYFENPLPNDPGVKWPVEMYDNSLVYVPDQKELENEKN